MSNLRLIADVHISPLTVTALNLQGYDIIRSTDFLPPNAADSEILELARTENRIILTQDLDFSMLIALSKHDRPSLITLRMPFPEPKLVTQRLLDVLPNLTQDLIEGSAITIDNDSIRIRKLPIR